MKENTFEIPSADGQKIETTQKTQNTEKIHQPTTNNNGENYKSYTPSSNATQNQEKSLDSMTREELNEELTTTQGTLTTQQSELSNILNGSTDELQGLQENIDTAYETYQTELAKVDGEMAQQLDDIETRLDALLSQKYPEVAQYMTAYNEAKEAYKTAQDTAVNAARTEITQTQNYINEINTAISNVGQKENIKENYFGVFGDDIVAFANQFIGANEADGSADKLLASWTTSAETPWCAAFVEYVMENSGNYEQLPDWYKDIENKWYCPNIDNAAEKAGAVINGDKAKAGDIVLFD